MAKKGEETYFKIKKSTLLHKVFVVYAERKGIKVSSLRFLYKGERVYRNGDTPQTFNMIDGDEIDCLLEQSGS
jgi:small ubiquitin-related modifier